MTNDHLCVNQPNTNNFIWKLPFIKFQFQISYVNFYYYSALRRYSCLHLYGMCTCILFPFYCETHGRIIKNSVLTHFKLPNWICRHYFYAYISPLRYVGKVDNTRHVSVILMTLLDSLLSGLEPKLWLLPLLKSFYVQWRVQLLFGTQCCSYFMWINVRLHSNYTNII